MKKNILHLYQLSFVVIIFFLSCKKDKSREGLINSNKPPTAIAGPDRVITLPTDSILLDGSASSDPDGMISEWLWTKISGPASFNINNASASKTVVKNLVDGVYQFELKVIDDKGLSAKDTMQVTVDAVVTANHSPVANAGQDWSTMLSCGPLSINLNAISSFDPDGDLLYYSWRTISGPISFSLSSVTDPLIAISIFSPGEYVFELKVTDPGGLSSKDTVIVTVTAFEEHNLDITFNGTYHFDDNEIDCDYYDDSCFYYDYISASGSGNMDSLGNLGIYFFEYYSDSASSSGLSDASMEILRPNPPDFARVISSGVCSVNFRKLIQSGGGNFSGNYTVTGGQAPQCILTGLPPLSVMGTLDTTTHIVNMHVKGKIYF